MSGSNRSAKTKKIRPAHPAKKWIGLDNSVKQLTSPRFIIEQTATYAVEHNPDSMSKSIDHLHAKYFKDLQNEYWFSV